MHTREVLETVVLSNDRASEPVKGCTSNDKTLEFEDLTTRQHVGSGLVATALVDKHTFDDSITDIASIMELSSSSLWSSVQTFDDSGNTVVGGDLPFEDQFVDVEVPLLLDSESQSKLKHVDYADYDSLLDWDTSSMCVVRPCQRSRKSTKKID